MNLSAKPVIEQMGIYERADVIREANAPLTDWRATPSLYLIVLDTWGGVSWGSVSVH